MTLQAYKAYAQYYNTLGAYKLLTSHTNITAQTSRGLLHESL